MVASGQPINSPFHGWHELAVIWLFLVIAVVPWGTWDICRTGREDWQDLTVEVDT